jgi:hypothetical protein
MKFEASYWMDKKTYALSAAQEELICLDSERFNKQHPFQWSNYEKNSRLINEDNILSKLSGACEGFPVLVIGAGNTMKQNLKMIRVSQKRFFIIAIDRAVKTLKDYCIKPDIIFSCDDGERVGEFLSCVDGEDTVAMNVTQHPDVVSMVNEKCKKLLFYSGTNPFDKVDGEIYKDNPALAFLRPGGVAGYAATDLGYWITCGKENAARGFVFLIGNEMGWFKLEDMKEDVGYYKGRELLKTKLPDGTDFYTIHNFRESADRFIDFENYYNDCCFIDCSGGIVKTKYKTDMTDAAMTVFIAGKSTHSMKFIFDVTCTGFWNKKAS